LFLNKFPVTKNHLIVCTEEFKKQESQNTDEDLYQTYRVVQALNGFGFFNSCPEGILNLLISYSRIICSA